MRYHDRHYVAALDAERQARAELETTVRAAARGDAAGWSRLVQRFTARVRRTASLHRLAPADVDDVVQTTWLRLYEHIDGVRDPAALGAWLDTTARRESLRVIGRSRRELPSEEPLDECEAADADAEREAVAAERRAALAAGVERLSPAQQRVIRGLLAHPTLSYAELSQKLDIPIGSIGPTRARCLARLGRDSALMRVVGEDA